VLFNSGKLDLLSTATIAKRRQFVLHQEPISAGSLSPLIFAMLQHRQATTKAQYFRSPTRRADIAALNHAHESRHIAVNSPKAGRRIRAVLNFTQHPYRAP